MDEENINQSGGVSVSSQRDTNIQGDAVGRDKITNITHNYYGHGAGRPYAQPRSPIDPTSEVLIVDAAAVIGFHVRDIEAYFHDPIEIVPLGIGSAEETPDGGESRTYEVGNHTFCVNYDKDGIARGLQITDGLLENEYTLEHWPVILSRLGMTVTQSPNIVAPAARRWNNFQGYGIMIAANRPHGSVWTVRVYKLSA